jgi:Ca-activated chloride channel homolog
MSSRSRRLPALGAALAFGLLALPWNVAHADDTTVRDFDPRGTKVSGLGTPSGAPEISPGVYQDTIGPVGDPSGVKYYLVRHTPGSNLFISATARPPKYGDQDRDDGMTITVRTQSWDECANWGHLREADYGMRGMAVADVAVGVEDDEGGLDTCTNERRLVLEIRRGDPDAQTPHASRPLGFELQIVEEPPVKNAARLPAPDDTEPTEDQGVAPRAPTGQVSGGAGFSDATTLPAGTSRDSIRPGELRFYRVRAGWGQKIALSVRTHPDSALLDSIDESEGLDARLRVYNPVRAEVVASNVETYNAREPLPFHAKLPEIRYNNRETENSWPVSIAGYYYLSFELERDGGDFAVPVEISVDVTGKVTGAPEYAGLGTPKPVPTQPDGESGAKVAALDSPISIGIASAGGVLVLIGVVLGALFLRRSA